jgi:hypothetical protein
MIATETQTDVAKRTLDDVVLALGSLSPEAIRDLFLAQGIKGFPTFLHCPVAQYLLKMGFSNPSVDPLRIEVVGDLTFTPANVREFISRFDLGKFPELEDCG